MRARFAKEGLEAALHHREQAWRKPRKLDGVAEAHLVAMVCGAPPEGRKRWSLHLLADQRGGGGLLRGGPQPRDRAPDAQRNALKPWLKKGGCIPPKANAECVAAMEDVLEVCHRPLDATRPLVCLDEAAKPLPGEVRAPLPMKPGQPERVDGESTREGTAAMFMLCKPLAGQRPVFVRAQRKRVDLAAVIKILCDELHPAAQKIVLVMDQINPHGVASLDAAFPPAEARRLAERLEIHHPPKPGSWLNRAEIELPVLARQCLDERMENQEKLVGAVAAWERSRNVAAPPHRLTLHHRRRSHQTQAPLPHHPTLKEY